MGHNYCRLYILILLLVPNLFLAQGLDITIVNPTQDTTICRGETIN